MITVDRVDRLLPPPLAERARAFASSGAVAVSPVGAATVVLLRDGPAGIETYLLRRLSTMAFAAGMYVFPGGRVDSGDGSIVAAAVRETHEETGVTLDASSLRAWARWVTPEFERRRYDTRFYVAAMPAGQIARPVEAEADAGEWIMPGVAVARFRSGQAPMLPPTVVVLDALSACETVAAVLDAAGNRDVRPVTPRVAFDGHDAYVVLPGEPGYD